MSTGPLAAAPASRRCAHALLHAHLQEYIASDDDEDSGNSEEEGDSRSKYKVRFAVFSGGREARPVPVLHTFSFPPGHGHFRRSFQS